MKNRLKIINILYGAQDYISGEALAKKLGISRIAVWKQIQEIKRENFIIETKPRLGYRIISCPDKLLPVIVEKGLKTETIGRKIYYYPTLDSTSSLALSLAQEDAPEGSLVLTEEQSHGRGRRGRQWVSPKGTGILASVILRPNLLPHQVPRIAIIGTVSVAESIRQVTGLETEMRWPNEVLLNNKRVAGILTEFTAELDKVNSVILGIGINVNLTPAQLSDLSNEATSLFIELGNKVSRLKLLQTLIEQLESNYDLLKAEQFHRIWQLWNARCWGRDKRVEVTWMGSHQKGVLKGIDENGSLIIAGTSGEEIIAMSGDISVRGA